MSQSTGTGAIASAAVSLLSGGAVNNHGLISSAGGPGISFGNKPGAVTNRGLIVGAGGPGISFGNKPGTLTNFGLVVGEATGTRGIGVYMRGGGLVTNEVGGVIRAEGEDGGRFNNR